MSAPPFAAARPARPQRPRPRARLVSACACSALALALLPATPATAAPIGKPLVRQLASLRLVDYFPSEAGWGEMWSRWEPGRLQKDFARIAALHGNAVRIILNAPAIGFPSPSPSMLSRVVQTVQIARQQGLRVELTLFDGWSDFAAVAESESWAREVLAPFRGDPEIAYIDVRNELPADTSASARSWAQTLLPYVKSLAGGVPVTISASISSGIAPLRALTAALAATPPDLYDVHYYGNAADAYAVLAEAKAAAGTTPLLVGETGFATSPAYGWAQGIEPDAASLDSYQDYYYRMVEAAAAALSLPPAAPWILYDMPGQGSTEWGHHMGILQADGAPKPAAAALAQVFAGSAPATSFDNSFEEGGSEPSIWRRWLPQEAGFGRDTTVAHSGHASARISDARGDHASGCPAFYAAPVAALRPGVLYTASAWARASAAEGTSRVVLVWTDSGGRYLSSSASSSLPSGDSGWTLLSVSAVPPAGAAAVEIDLQVCEDPGTTWFDDVGFSPTNVPGRPGAAARERRLAARLRRRAAREDRRAVARERRRLRRGRARHPHRHGRHGR